MSSSVASSWHRSKRFCIRNPLVAIIGIGKYHGMQQLIGMNQDYVNIIKTFGKSNFNYNILYKLENGEYKTESPNVKDKFKIEWYEDDITDFVDKCKDTIINNKHDALIFIISSHGESDSFILDSSCTECSLLEIFSQFDGTQFSQFAANPKLFFIDACRGSRKSKPVEVCITINDETQEISVLQPTDRVKGTSTQETNDEKNNKNNTNNSKNKNQNRSDRDPNSEIDEKNKKKMEKKEKKNNKPYETNTNNEKNAPENKKNTLTANSNSSVNDNNNKMTKSEKSKLTKENLNIHTEANFFFVYANPDGYAAFDGGEKGGYLIQAIHKVFKKPEIYSENLDSISKQIASKVRQLVGLQSMQHVQTVSNVHYSIQFEKHKQT